MQNFEFKTTTIADLILVIPPHVSDKRGYFTKVFEKAVFKEHGIEFLVWEELLTCSQKDVLRGLHFQRSNCQAKLVQVLCGKAFDVVVDLRKGSPTFGKWESFELSGENQKILYVPKGLAHGFLSLEENTVFKYLCGDGYVPEMDGGICWNDPQLAIKWPLDCIDRLIVSDRDKNLPMLADFLENYGPLDVEANT